MKTVSESYMYQRASKARGTARAVAVQILLAIVFVLAMAPPAFADCSATPGYGDISDVSMARCDANTCFSVVMGSNGLQAEARMVEYDRKRKGHFVARLTPSFFDEVRGVLQQTHFLRLNVPQPSHDNPRAVMFHFGAPEQQIMSKECNSLFGIHVGSVYDENSRGYGKFVHLMDSLAALVEKAPWQRKDAKATMYDVLKSFQM